ncbi:hypothetical protein MAUB_01380 [Mycolicibacterium aubagnense]|uniref:Uncharacterized protein n=1 Tax=Mycolicibacterium aubagnense TaxID=319707 RepID=A0ABN5YKS0_9MYCO|nr:hypothetical protein MAUB_01380 [Mycolicibacterium aubagnense]
MHLPCDSYRPWPPSWPDWTTEIARTAAKFSAHAAAESMWHRCARVIATKRGVEMGVIDKPVINGALR